ncbi:hypothetical protein MB02_16305 [Croceicoccus estronivorus]|uniref:response regulator transcription factor n=1 Tax=Croceicoccus estronivorus TaxID=1172626 RepID=UPI000836AD93|nr:response regulator transcription factor [Croceicoccus estronivorus]OCC22573.1 hypothetical protein MB02_16305 [Croceicoccus estronivorus]
MTKPAHIVIVEDDAPLRALLARLLCECGYEATGVSSGVEFSHILAHPGDRPIDLVLLDIMLPDENGLTLCQRIRKTSQVPIIMVSARGQEADRVAGLDIGADDYIPKPFSRPELLARIRAALRRGGESRISPESSAPECYRFEEWRFFPKRRELFAPSGAQVSLTAAEHELLLTLLRHSQQTIGRGRLMELVRSRLPHSHDRSIDVLVSRLRKKLGGARRSLSMIRTVRGVGYVFIAETNVS